eukprot:15441622-Alexandrium_andersonii.AAC.1
MLRQGNECSRELVLLLRHKIARVADPNADAAGGSNEPAPVPSWSGRGRGGRGKKSKARGRGSNEPKDPLPAKSWGLHMDSSGWVDLDKLCRAMKQKNRKRGCRPKCPEAYFDKEWIVWSIMADAVM